jgi:hypothetical protein
MSPGFNQRNSGGKIAATPAAAISRQPASKFPATHTANAAAANDLTYDMAARAARRSIIAGPMVVQMRVQFAFNPPKRSRHVVVVNSVLFA